jgi:ParB-like chromosome segregation protein Spo0J
MDDAELPRAQLVCIDELGPAVAQRTEGVDEAHVRLLAGCLDRLPPIWVQRGTMRIIDGMHRVRAAQMCDRIEVSAVLLDDDDDRAFMRAVHANVAHGLPLSLADRRRATRRILEMNPQWSDRLIGRTAGLSDKTVAAIRRESGTDQVSDRVGRDGRLRPVNGSAGRDAARSMLERRPDAPLRHIASVSGISPGTVRDVRDRIRNEAASERGCPPSGGGTRPAWSRARPAEIDSVQLVRNLSLDPSLRYTDTGRSLLRHLHQQQQLEQDDRWLEAVPVHCLGLLAQLCRAYATQWEQWADRLVGRGTTASRVS